MPKVLFEDPAYKKLSDGGKLLYCVLLNRMGLSKKNEWRDENGKVYIYYTNRKLRELFGWGHDKVTGRYKELERAGLIRRRKDKIGGPDSIYVLPLPEVSGFSAPGGSVLQQPPLREISADPCDDFAASKTEYKKTEIRENDLSADGYDATFFSNRIKGNIDYDILSEYKVDKAKLDELIRLMTDVCCGTAPMVRIGGSDYYMSGNYLKPEVLVTYQVKSNVNYRTGAGTSHTKKGQFKKGTSVSIVQGWSKKVSGKSWYRVKVGSKYYYVMASYLTKKETILAYTNHGKVNVRTGAGTDKTRKTKLLSGTPVHVVKGGAKTVSGDAWERVKVEGKY